MKRANLKIAIILMITFFLFINCSCAASGLDVLQQHQQSIPPSETNQSQTHPNADTNLLNDEQWNASNLPENNGNSYEKQNQNSSDNSSGLLCGRLSGGSGESSSGSSGGSSGGEQDIDDVISSADNFIEQGENNSGNTIDQDAAQKAIDLIYNILLAVGLVVAVICGLILGIQFMMSSSEGQAQVKEKLIPFVVRMCCNFWSFWDLEIGYGASTRILEK